LRLKKVEMEEVEVEKGWRRAKNQTHPTIRPEKEE
jgi:hypothetical protein